MHGHRYRFEAEIEGDVVDVEGVSEEGMLIDFSDVSKILNEQVHDIIDHAFLYYEKDELLVNLFDIQEKIVLNSDVDNNSKEDKNNIDITEESKIFEEYFNPIFFLNESLTSNYLSQNFIEVLSSKDFPPLELNS